MIVAVVLALKQVDLDGQLSCPSEVVWPGGDAVGNVLVFCFFNVADAFIVDLNSLYQLSRWAEIPTGALDTPIGVDVDLDGVVRIWQVCGLAVHLAAGGENVWVAVASKSGRFISFEYGQEIRIDQVSHFRWEIHEAEHGWRSIRGVQNLHIVVRECKAFGVARLMYVKLAYLSDIQELARGFR